MTAFELCHLSTFVLDHFRQLDHVGMSKLHFASNGPQSKVSLRWVLLIVTAVDEKALGKTQRARAAGVGAGRLLREIGDALDELLLVVVDNFHFQRVQHRQPSLADGLQIFSPTLLHEIPWGGAVAVADAHPVGHALQPLRPHAAASDAADRQQPRIVPAADVALLHQPQQLSLGGDGSLHFQPGKLLLVGSAWNDAAVIQEPVVQGPVVLKFQGANGVRDTFDCILVAVRKVVHGIDLPLVTASVVAAEADPVHGWISHVHVGMLHVDLRSQQLRTFCVLSILHLLEELQVLLHTAVPKLGVHPWQVVGPSSAVLLHLLWCLRIHVRLAMLDEINGKVVHLLEIITGIKDLILPGFAALLHLLHVQGLANPGDVFLNRFHILSLFCVRIGVIEA
mmetsp:Transcript_750/g.1130  ORF Transcript_750/g.1130 Transcript_750/m.1130 type:complete len:395 (-) Transcript_750:113-1297(-)